MNQFTLNEASKIPGEYAVLLMTVIFFSFIYILVAYYHLLTLMRGFVKKPETYVLKHVSFLLYVIKIFCLKSHFVVCFNILFKCKNVNIFKTLIVKKR